MFSVILRSRNFYEKVYKLTIAKKTGLSEYIFSYQPRLVIIRITGIKLRGLLGPYRGIEGGMCHPRQPTTGLLHHGWAGVEWVDLRVLIRWCGCGWSLMYPWDLYQINSLINKEWRYNKYVKRPINYRQHHPLS